MSDVCRSCKAPVLWARTTKGRSVPLDAEAMGGWTSPTKFDDGNLRPTGDRVPGPGGTTVMIVEHVPPGSGRHYRAHFVSCPDAESWRKR